MLEDANGIKRKKETKGCENEDGNSISSHDIAAPQGDGEDTEDLDPITGEIRVDFNLSFDEMTVQTTDSLDR